MASLFSHFGALASARHFSLLSPGLRRFRDGFLEGPVGPFVLRGTISVDAIFKDFGLETLVYTWR